MFCALLQGPSNHQTRVHCVRHVHLSRVRSVLLSCVTCPCRAPRPTKPTGRLVQAPIAADRPRHHPRAARARRGGDRGLAARRCDGRGRGRAAGYADARRAGHASRAARTAGGWAGVHATGRAWIAWCLVISVSVVRHTCLMWAGHYASLVTFILKHCAPQLVEGPHSWNSTHRGILTGGR